MTVVACHKVDNKRTKVCLDNDYSFVLYNSELRRFRISEGRDMEPSHISEINKILKNRIRNRILYMLGNNDKTREDIKNRLIMSGYPEDITESVIEELVMYGYIDDERYVRNYIESVSLRKSRREIINYLRNHNVDLHMAQRIIGETEMDESAAIIKNIAKKGYTLEEFVMLDYDKRNKIVQFLLRKGFSMDSIRHICS